MIIRQVTAAMYIKDENRTLTVHTDRSQGAMTALVAPKERCRSRWQAVMTRDARLVIALSVYSCLFRPRWNC